MLNTVMHRQFCHLVRDFAKEYADLTLLKQMVVTGEVYEKIHEDRLNQLLGSISDKMEQIETMEKQMGYENVGIPVQDANFEGFSIVDGEMDGTKVSNAYLIAEPWICDFWDARRTGESDCFKFFVGSLLYYMAGQVDPSVMNELNGKEKENDKFEKGKRKEGSKEGCRKIYDNGHWFRGNWNVFLKRVHAFFSKKSESAGMYP